MPSIDANPRKPESKSTVREPLRLTVDEEIFNTFIIDFILNHKKLDTAALETIFTAPLDPTLPFWWYANERIIKHAHLDPEQMKKVQAYLQDMPLVHVIKLHPLLNGPDRLETRAQFRKICKAWLTSDGWRFIWSRIIPKAAGKLAKGKRVNKILEFAEKSLPAELKERVSSRRP